MAYYDKLVVFLIIIFVYSSSADVRAEECMTMNYSKVITRVELGMLYPANFVYEVKNLPMHIIKYIKTLCETLISQRIMSIAIVNVIR